MYQSMAFQIPNVDLSTAQKIFPEDCLVANTPGNVSTWKLETFEGLARGFSPVMCMSHYVCAGLTRGLKEPSERVIRVVATLLPGAEVTHVILPRGVDRLYFNAEYVLADEMGELHPPKNSQRQEKELQDEWGLRQRLYSDLVALFNKGAVLAPGFLRQIGKHAQADELEARLLNQAAAVQAGESAKEALELRDFFDVATIREEKWIGREIHYLVVWAGYHPTWEQWRWLGQGNVGDPVESWEPWDHVAGTEALVVWEPRPAQ